MGLVLLLDKNRPSQLLLRGLYSTVPPPHNDRAVRLVILRRPFDEDRPHELAEPLNLPTLRNLPDLSLLDPRVPDPPGHEGLEEALLHPLRLLDDLPRGGDGVVHAGEDDGDLLLFGEGGEGYRLGAKSPRIDVTQPS